MSKIIKIATWNVNSIRSRLSHVVDWLKANTPTVLCLQETKVQDIDFPRKPFEELGYNLAIFGQKSYNGVAIFSSSEISEIHYGFPDDPIDAQRRLISATVEGIRVLCVYIPNGESISSPKFEYKMDFMQRLENYITNSYKITEPLVMCGDFNVAPSDIDLFDPIKNRETVMFHSREHTFLKRWKEWGFIDVVRQLHPNDIDLYSWWDYRTAAFQRDRGWRIDHIWTTKSFAQYCVEASIDKTERAKEKPSDHAPVVATFTQQ